jgi:hypothetical protein
VLIVVSSVALMLGLATLPAAQAQTGDTASAAQDPVRVLVFHGPADKQDDPVASAAGAVEKLGKKNNFSVDEFDDPRVFSPETLAHYRAVVFLSANGVTLTATSRRRSRPTSSRAAASSASTTPPARSPTPPGSPS